MSKNPENELPKQQQKIIRERVTRAHDRLHKNSKIDDRRSGRGVGQPHTYSTWFHETRSASLPETKSIRPVSRSSLRTRSGGLDGFPARHDRR